MQMAKKQPPSIDVDVSDPSYQALTSYEIECKQCTDVRTCQRSNIYKNAYTGVHT